MSSLGSPNSDKLNASPARTKRRNPFRSPRGSPAQQRAEFHSPNKGTKRPKFRERASEEPSSQPKGSENGELGSKNPESDDEQGIGLRKVPQTTGLLAALLNKAIEVAGTTYGKREKRPDTAPNASKESEDSEVESVPSAQGDQGSWNEDTSGNHALSAIVGHGAKEHSAPTEPLTNRKTQSHHVESSTGPSHETSSERLVGPLAETLSVQFSTDQQIIEPSAVQFSVIEPSEIEPSAIEQSPIEPSAIEPSVMEPSAIEPSAIEPSVTGQTAIGPSIDASIIEPSDIEPVIAEPSVVEPSIAEDEDIIDTRSSIRMSSSSDEINVSTELQGSKLWVQSQRHLIVSLNREFGLAASTLGQFISDQGLEINGLGSDELVRLAHALSSYVVCPRKGRASAPDSMPRSQKALYLTTDSTEEFLVRLWRAQDPHIEATSFNAELYTGPWHDLAIGIGREWVTYIMLHCHVFRPLVQGSIAVSTGCHWLHLSGRLQWRKQPDWRQRGHTPPSAEPIFVTKIDIMFKKRALKMEDWAPCNDLAGVEQAPSGISALIEITQKRLRQFQAQLVHKRIPAPQPRSRRHRWTSHKEVIRLLSRRVRKLVPLNVFGSRHNWRVVDAALSRFVKAFGFSKVLVKPLLKGMKTSEIAWIRESVPSGEQQLKILASVLKWVFDHIVKPLLAYHFYITEMSGQPGTVYYYEKLLWLREFDFPARVAMVKRHFLPLTAESNGTSEGDEDARAARFLRTREMPVVGDYGNPWRVVPKHDGSSRPIINLKNVNENLRNAHLVLQHSMPAVPSRLDSWHSWITRLYEFRDRVTEKGKVEKKFYVVVLDISGCYDNANVRKVRDVLQANLDSGKQVYRVQSIRKQELGPQWKYEVKDQVMTLPERPVKPLTEPTPSNSRAEATDETPFHNKVSTSVVSETSRSKIIQGDEILEDIDQLFSDIRLTVSRSQTIQFTCGIPQGSSCSLDLCNMLLDDLIVQKLARFTADQNSLLLRYVDDFLFVTTDKSLAVDFQATMVNDFEDEYGVKSKNSKAVSNIDTERPRKMDFLGYTFNSETLDVLPRAVSLMFDGQGKTPVALKKALDRDVDYMLGALRSFQRNGKQPPKKLVNETAAVFGAALVSRISSFERVFEATTEATSTGISHGETYKRVVNKYMIPLVATNHAHVRRIVQQSYSYQRASQQEQHKCNSVNPESDSIHKKVKEAENDG